jgi:hypothetical protein
VARSAGRLEASTVQFTAGRDGWRAWVCGGDHAAVYHQTGSFRELEFSIPLPALDDFAGKRSEPVTLKALSDGKVEARWQEGNVPQIVLYACADASQWPSLPQTPEQWIQNGPALLQALRDALDSTGGLDHRYGLSRVQLTGSGGKIAATNGKQLLIQEGYRFPWSEALLVPGAHCLSAREIPAHEEVEIGKTKTHVVLRAGPWTFFLQIDTETRFPNIDAVVPRASKIASRCIIADEDADFLLRTMPHLPGQGDDQAPLTVDLQDDVKVRARAAEREGITEVVLQRSTATGASERFCTDRRLLARALTLGFRQFQIVDAATPILCEDGRRRFVWMPLDKDGVIAPSADAVRILSEGHVEKSEERLPCGRQRTARPAKDRPLPASTTSPSPTVETISPPDVLPMASASTELASPTMAAHSKGRSRVTNWDSDLNGLIEEAQALQQVLRDAYTRTHRLLIAARRQRKQAQAVRAAMASLRQLQQASA